jgi:uncharacterized membrane protein
MNNALVLELAAAAFSLALISGYHVFQRMRLREDPSRTIQAATNRARVAWVERMMKEREGILAVQTLRNSIMSATFFASTAVALIVGTVTLSTQSEALRRVSDSLAATEGGAVWFFKVMVLLVDMLCAFIFFSQTIRLLSHVSLMISAPVEAVNPSTVAKLLIRSGRHHTRGMRCYYYAGPMLFWLFGPAYLAAASIGLVVAMYFLDDSPT